MAEWVPLVYRSDGAWIGTMSDGEIGVGVELEGRTSLRDSGFVPMWPFMERTFGECFDEFSRMWMSFKGCGISTPEKLMELTVVSAWSSGRAYWMELAASWVIDMVQWSSFNNEPIREILIGMARSEVLSSELRVRLAEISSTL